MNIIDFEVEEIEKLCENVIPNSKIIVCTANPTALVRVDLKNPIRPNAQLTICLRFPNDYPQNQILIELKSRTLAQKFLEGLTTICDQKAREILGKPQGLHVLRFVQQYLDDNKLSICFDEIQQLRKLLNSSDNTSTEQLKLKQRNSTVQLVTKVDAYYYRIIATIPNEYPQRCVDLEFIDSNLPEALVRYLNGQSREIARKCVEPPLATDRNGKAIENFKITPSVWKSLKFCIEAANTFCNEICPICNEKILPKDPQNIEKDDSKDNFIERVYCGHLFHQGCLKLYLREPPFPKDGKKCPAKIFTANTKKEQSQQKSGSRRESTICGIRLAHDRWVLNIKVAESRWAQKQARERELEEVIDFMQ